MDIQAITTGTGPAPVLALDAALGDEEGADIELP